MISVSSTIIFIICFLEYQHESNISQKTKRLNQLETADILFQEDLLKKAEQEPKNLEMFMLIEHLAGQIESIEKEIEASRYNKVNIDHFRSRVVGYANQSIV